MYQFSYLGCKLVCFNLKIASFTDDKEVSFASHISQPINILANHIAETLGFERFEKVNSALTKVIDKDEYLKVHPLTDKFGVPIEIGDYVASGAGSAAIICKVQKINPSTINWGISPKSCIIVRAKDPNKKLGW